MLLGTLHSLRRYLQCLTLSLVAALAPLRARGLFDAFPFGTDFTPVELKLAGALQWLKQRSARSRGRIGLLWRALRTGAARPDEVAALERMGLENPQSLAERWQRRLVLTGLRR